MDWDVVIINPKIMCGQPDNHVFLIFPSLQQISSDVWFEVAGHINAPTKEQVDLLTGPVFMELFVTGPEIREESQ